MYEKPDFEKCIKPTGTGSAAVAPSNALSLYFSLYKNSEEADRVVGPSLSGCLSDRHKTQDIEAEITQSYVEQNKESSIKSTIARSSPSL